MTATITLNTAPHRKARITFRHGSLPYRAVFRIHTMKTIGIVKAEIKRTPRKYGESAKPANVAPGQRSPNSPTCSRSFAWAAARRATGTRKGEHDT